MQVRESSRERLLNVADRDAQPAGTNRDCAAAHEDP
jgi:hypothetical protein